MTLCCKTSLTFQSLRPYTIISLPILSLPRWAHLNRSSYAGQYNNKYYYFRFERNRSKYLTFQIIAETFIIFIYLFFFFLHLDLTFGSASPYVHHVFIEHNIYNVMFLVYSTHTNTVSIILFNASNLNECN